MVDWKSRSEIQEDVVFFRYVSEGIEKGADQVYVWDLDKTYLDTSIDSLAGLFLTAVERAFNKRNVPGTKVLLQVLSQAWAATHGQDQLPIYFITASPPQMESRITEKFAYDQIKPYGSFYKDNLRNLTPKRFWRLNKQVGYKIQALLQLRMRLKENVRQVLWGDDSEQDAVIYNLYSDICARRIGSQDLRAILRSLSVTNEQSDTILLLQSKIPENDPVEKIYINLAVDTDPDYYLKFGRRTLPSYNTLQIALDLFQDQRINENHLGLLIQDMIYNYGFTPEELIRSFEELVRRKVLGETSTKKLVLFFLERGLIPPSYQLSIQPAKELSSVQGRVYELEGHYEPWVPARIDYLHDYR